MRDSISGLPVYDSDLRLLVKADGTVTPLEETGVPVTGRPVVPRFRRPDKELLAIAVEAAGVRRAAQTRLERGLRVEAGGLAATWDVQAAEGDGTHHWHLRIDDASGRVLSITDWARECRFHASLPPGTSVDDTPPTLLACPADADASPFGWNDLDGIPGADDTTTRGVNVQAQEDEDGNDSGGARVDGGPGLDFNFPFTPGPPAANREFTIAQGFALHNRLHDVLYHYGFGPADGNHQQNNYGRGGVAGDPVLVDIHDGAGTNNAIAISPPDGQPGRLNFYVFSRPQQVAVTRPAGIGTLAASGASFGAALPPGGLAGEVALAADAGDAEGPATNDVCSVVVNPADIAGKIALVDRGVCTFITKVKNAQAAGAIAVIVANHTANALVSMLGADPSIHIPAVFVGLSDGNRLKSALSTGAVEVVLSGSPFVDGALDHTLAIHEHAHLLTQRLTGGPANADVLSQTQGAGMSEGWSDWYALVLTARATDTAAQPRPVGAYANGNAATGFRSVAYSTDMGVNPLTYASIRTLSRRHDIGEVWCSVLWDFHWQMVASQGFSPDFIRGDAGNQRALRLVTEALKLQPSQPTFLQGRDALLLADQLLYDGENACRIWKAFARRGMGVDALDGGASTSNLVTDGFQLPPVCAAAEPVVAELHAEPPHLRLEWDAVTGGVYRVQGGRVAVRTLGGARAAGYRGGLACVGTVLTDQQLPASAGAAGSGSVSAVLPRPPPVHGPAARFLLERNDEPG
jgi:extracellular elastinolytic metalloproteinase